VSTGKLLPLDNWITLKMEAASYLVTSVTMYYSTRRPIPENILSWRWRQQAPTKRPYLHDATSQKTRIFISLSLSLSLSCSRV